MDKREKLDTAGRCRTLRSLFTFFFFTGRSGDPL